LALMGAVISVSALREQRSDAAVLSAAAAETDADAASNSEMAFEFEDSDSHEVVEALADAGAGEELDMDALESDEQFVQVQTLDDAEEEHQQSPAPMPPSPPLPWKLPVLRATAPNVNAKTPPVTCTAAQVNGGQQLSAIRQKIIDTAMAYVGKIGDRLGKRTGADLLLDIYNTAYHIDVTTWGWGPLISTVGKQPNSWCGIFAVAMVCKAGVPGAGWARWDAKPPSQPFGLASSTVYTDGKFSPGDMLLIKDPPGQNLNHQCICKSIDGNVVNTIDGNSFDPTTTTTNTVKETKRSLSDVRGYYKVVPDPAWVALVDGMPNNCKK